MSGKIERREKKHLNRDQSMTHVQGGFPHRCVEEEEEMMTGGVPVLIWIGMDN